MDKMTENSRIKAVTYDLKGFDSLGKMLEDLPKEIENKVLSDVSRSGARELREYLRAAAPANTGKQSENSKRYGTIRENIRVEFLRWTRGREGIRGWRVVTGDAFWGNFLEFGTRFIPARRGNGFTRLGWFTKTVESSAPQVLSGMVAEMADSINKHCNSMIKRLKL